MNLDGPAVPPFDVWVGVVAAAAVGALIVPSGPPGIGFLITGVAVAAAVARARPRPLDLESGGFAGAALVLLSMATFRDAGWVVVVDVAAASVCGALAITGAPRWATTFAAPWRVVRDAFLVPVSVARSIPRGGSIAWLGPAGRAAFASAVLLLTFGALFASADAAFADIAASVLLPDIAVDLLPARLFVGLVIAAGAGGLILVARRPEPTPGEGRLQIRVSTLEWALPLLALDALFAAFVVVQLAVLFGGHAHVLETAGLTYAQYARAGFFQLLVVAVLVLGVVAVAVRVAGPPQGRLLKILLGVLCVLTLVVLASALRRMNLYEDVYGLTRIRVSVYAVDLWLAAVFVAVIVAGSIGRWAWLPRAVAALSVAGLLAFNAANPDALIARSATSLEHTSEIDTYYLSTLSADALPALMELPPEVRGCIASRIATGIGSDAPWTSFNVSRQAALRQPTTEEPACSY